MNDLDTLLAAAVEIAEAAGPIALRAFRQPLEVVNKATGADFDPVTEADRAIERCLRSELERRFPDDGILGEEEEAKEASGSRRRWVLDPIDGTRAFLSGSPAWGILLGLMENGDCRLGVMHQPYLRETFAGTPAGGWLQRPDADQVALASRSTARLDEAILYCTHPTMFLSEEHHRAFGSVAAACRLVRYGGDCYSYCLLALGCIDLVIEDDLKPFDIIPLIPLIEGAGGVVTDREGGPAIRGGFVVAAANRELHRQALALIERELSADQPTDDDASGRRAGRQ